MGMSGDFSIAIEEGATRIRIGTALFGPRKKPVPAQSDEAERGMIRETADGRDARRARAARRKEDRHYRHVRRGRQRAVEDRRARAAP